MTGPLELPILPVSIGPYQILRVLGQGGMGVVYLGEHRASGALAAIKTVRLAREGLLSGLRREIRALQSLSHPGVVRILEQGVEAGMPWYAMELLHGATLADRIRVTFATGEQKTAELEPLRSGFSATVPISSRRGSAVAASRADAIATRPPAAGGALPFALSILRELCESLAFIHGEGMIHGDIKPENIFLADGGAPVLMDFGIALRSRGGMGREVLDIMAPAGTVAYMAPEQIRGELVDARADLYSVGCVLYEVVTGRPPFVESSIQAVMTAHASATPPRLSTLVDGAPHALDDLLYRLLAKRPRDRIGHADDVGRELALLGGARLRPSVEGRPKAYVYRPELVGRKAALDVLTSCLKRAGKGRGSAVLVRGESGIGKTYLATASARAASKRGLTVIAGACVPFGASSRQGAPSIDASLHPFTPFLQAVADRCLAGGPQYTATLLGDRGKVLAACAPFLAALPGEEATVEPPELPVKAARERLLGALADTILIFASQSPLLLVLDDLQWADELSLELLALLLDGRLDATPLLLLGTYRAEETSPALLALSAQPGVERVTLDRLDEASVGAMVADMLALAAVPSSFASFLTREAHGNPFFVAEYVRTAVAEGLLRRGASGRWEMGEGKGVRASTSRLPLPSSLRELIVHHLSLLSEGGRCLASAASVLGREAKVELLLDVAELPEDAAQAALQELVNRQIVEEPAPGQIRLLHDKLREVAYAEISPDARRAMHRRAALAIEARERERERGMEVPARFYAELAHHFACAGEPDKSIKYLEKAGAQALASFASREAAAFFHGVIELGEEALLGPEAPKVRRDPSAIAAAARARRLSPRDKLAFCRWERQLADAYHGLGELRSMREHAARALSWAGTPPPPDRKGWTLRLCREIPIQAAHRLFPGALARRVDSGVERELGRERARALVRLSKAAYFGSDRQWVVSSLWCANEAEQAGAIDLATRAYTSIGLLFGTQRLPALSRRYFKLARVAAELGRDEAALSVSFSVEALSLIETTRWDEARAACAAAERIVERIRDGHDRELLWAIIGILELSVGRFEASVEAFGRVARSAKERGDTQHLAWSLLGEALARLRLGQLAEVKRLIAEAQEPVAASEDQSMHIQRAALLAQVHLHEGDMVKARREAEFAASMVNRLMPLNTQLFGYGVVAEVYLARWEQALRGHPAEAARARKAAARVLRPLFVCSLKSSYAAPLYHRLKGRERWLAGAEEHARAELDRAILLARELKMPYGEATSLLELARTLPQGSEARGAHLARAEALFEEMRCRRELEACWALRGFEPG